jgi:hypothetical protein
MLLQSYEKAKQQASVNAQTFNVTWVVLSTTMVNVYAAERLAGQPYDRISAFCYPDGRVQHRSDVCPGCNIKHDASDTCAKCGIDVDPDPANQNHLDGKVLCDDCTQSRIDEVNDRTWGSTPHAGRGWR